jgi:hypothetical protein
MHGSSPTDEIPKDVPLCYAVVVASSKVDRCFQFVDVVAVVEGEMFVGTVSHHALTTPVSSALLGTANPSIISNAKPDHFSISFDGEALADIFGIITSILGSALVSDRRKFVSAALPQTIVTKVFETPHPYLDNMGETCQILIPGALEISVSFDAKSSTEDKYDYVKFTLDKEGKQLVGAEKYCGKTFPGLGDMSPLVAQTDSLFWTFKSDGT